MKLILPYYEYLFRYRVCFGKVSEIIDLKVCQNIHYINLILIDHQTTNFQHFCNSSQPGASLIYLHRNRSNVRCDIYKYGLRRNSLLKYSNPLSPSEFPNWHTISLLAVMNRQQCIRVLRRRIDRPLKTHYLILRNHKCHIGVQMY